MLGIAQIDISEGYPRQNKNLSPVSGFCLGIHAYFVIGYIGYQRWSRHGGSGGTTGGLGSDHDVRVLLP
jgi:hypothetical protein